MILFSEQKVSGKYIFNYILQKVICFVSFFFFFFFLSFFKRSAITEVIKVPIIYVFVFRGYNGGERSHHDSNRPKTKVYLLR